MLLPRYHACDIPSGIGSPRDPGYRSEISLPGQNWMDSHHFSTALVGVSIILATFMLTPAASQETTLASELSPTSSCYHEAFDTQTPLQETPNLVHISDQQHEIASVCMPNGSMLAVVHQPQKDPGYVSSEPETLTLFKKAESFETIGFLAHNDLAGQYILNLRINQDVQVIYKDGSSRWFRINSIQPYQALSPSSPYSDFMESNNGESRLSSTELFYEIYTAKGQVIFQTCIAHEGQMDWGRLFVTAEPLEDQQHPPVPPLHTLCIDLWGQYVQSGREQARTAARE
jgi:hypothetical protein